MASPTWEEIFGPTPKHTSNQSKPDHISQVLNRTRRVSAELQGVQNRLIDDDHIGRIDCPVAKHIREAQIISKNAEAMLKAVEQVLKEKVAKRVEEENRVRWPWPDVKLARVKPVVPPRPTARSKAEFRSNVSREETDAGSERVRRDGRQHKKSPKPVGETAAQRALIHRNALRSSGKADLSLTNADKRRVPSDTSSKYSQSTSSVQQPSIRSSTSAIRDDEPIAWPWPASIVQAASGRSSGSFSAGHSTSARASASSEREDWGC